MTARIDPQGQPQASDAARQSSAVSADLPDQGVEFDARQAREAFELLFCDLMLRIDNRRIVEAADLSHGADGVLRPVGMSPKKRGESLREGGPR